MEPVCESYGAYDMVSKISICNAMIILILCSQTNVWSYKTRNQGTNKLDIILLGSAVLQMIKHWNHHQFVIKWNCIDHGIS